MMINKYYVRKLKKLLEKNTRYYNKERAGEPLPYIITDEKDYYKIILCVEKLTDKNDITDGLIDILENRIIEQQKVLDKIREKVNQYDFISGYYYENYGQDNDTLKEDILELLEELK